jgi:hypothetical protein
MPNRPFPIPFADMADTRAALAVATQQRRVNFYPHSKGGVRQFPGLIEFSSFSAPAFLRSNLTIYDSGVTNSYMNTTATRIYGKISNTIKQVTLSTAGDISTASSTTTQTGTLIGSGIWVNATEDRYYTIEGSTVDTIKQGKFTTPGDITTEDDDGLTLTITPDTQGTLPSVLMTPDESRAIVCDGGGGTSGKVFQYDLATPEDITTGVKTFTFDGLALHGYSLSDADWSSDGAKIFFVDRTNALVVEFLLSTAYDLSTIGSSPNATFDVSAKASAPTTIFFNQANSGKHFYVGDIGDLDALHQYDTPSYAVTNASAFSGAGRGAINHGGVLYIVLADKLYSITSGGGPSQLATIGGSGIVDMATDGTTLLIVTGANKYQYSVAAGFSEITDTDLGTAYTTAYLDLRYYFDQDNGQIIGSALNDPSDIDPLTFQTAESFNDDLLAVKNMGRLLYAFGVSTLEIFITSGVPRPLLRRQKVIEHGIIGRRAVATIDDSMYILDDRRRPAVIRELALQQIQTSTPLGRELRTYATVSDCIVNAYSFESENFIEYLFPTQDISWTLHEASGQWSKREDTSNTSFPVMAYVNCYNKLLGLDQSAGKVWEFGSTTYQDNAVAITRTIDSVVIDSNLLGIPEQKLTIPRTKIRYDTSGSAAISVSVAKDDNLTSFATAITNTVSGSGVLTIQRFPGGICRECVIRITTTANARVDILDLSIDASLQEDSND